MVNQIFASFMTSNFPPKKNVTRVVFIFELDANWTVLRLSLVLP